MQPECWYHYYFYAAIQIAPFHTALQFINALLIMEPEQRQTKNQRNIKLKMCAEHQPTNQPIQSNKCYNKAYRFINTGSCITVLVFYFVVYVTITTANDETDKPNNNFAVWSNVSVSLTVRKLIQLDNHFDDINKNVTP